jgi:hypothetical protein
MKKSKLFALMLLATGVTVFTACSEDDKDPEPTPIPPTTYYEYEAKLLGGADNPSVGSFLTTQDSLGTVYLTAAATSNQPKIDIIFYYGGSTGNNSTLASPDDSVFSNPNSAQNPHPAVFSWVARNETRFKPSLSDFNDITNDDQLESAVDTNSATAQTKMVQLDEGDVITFITDDNRKGIFEVDSIGGTGGSTRVIRLNVKVQR